MIQNNSGYYYRVHYFSYRQQQHRANLALAIGGFTCFALLYGTQPVLPQLTRDFAVSPASASLSVAAGTATMAVLLIPLSLIGDRYGREKLMRVGLTAAALFAFA